MKVYIIDVYEKYRKEGNEVSVHWIGGRQWCIREVEMEWGLPQIQEKVEYDEDPTTYHIYERYEDAREYLQQMQSINGGIK